MTVYSQQMMAHQSTVMAKISSNLNQYSTHYCHMAIVYMGYMVDGWQP